MPKMNGLTKRVRSKPFRPKGYGGGAYSAGASPSNIAATASRQASAAATNKLPTRALDEVMSILVSVQWDCWRFMLPAKPLLDLDVAVVSHGDLDHWHQNFWEKDLLLVPWWLRIPDRFSCLKNIYPVGSTASVGQLEFKVLGKTMLEAALHRKVDTHAYWWLVRNKRRNVSTLFVGDLDLSDVDALQEFINHYSRRCNIRCLLLPSFGGVMGHGARTPAELQRSVQNIVQKLKGELGIAVGSLPHPVNAGWADFTATRI